MSTARKLERMRREAPEMYTFQRMHPTALRAAHRPDRQTHSSRAGLLYMVFVVEIQILNFERLGFGSAGSESGAARLGRADTLPAQLRS
jgi:hypothetical protein